MCSGRKEIGNLSGPGRLTLVVTVLITIQAFMTTGIVACQVPLSMEFSRQESWSGLPFPPPGDFPIPEI